MIQVTIVDARARALLARLPSAFGRRLWGAVGKRVEVTVRRHFLSLNARPNQKGWPKKGFWKKEGYDKTALTAVTDRGATVSIASPAIAHKLDGGKVTAKRVRMLAIPATAKAYKRGSPGEGRWKRKELFIVKPRSGAWFLATRKGKGKRATIEPQYWLKKSVTHEPDPDTLPSQDELNEAARREAIRVIDEAIAKTRTA